MDGQMMGDIQPGDHLGLQAPCCTIGPPTGPKQIMSLLHLDIHRLHPGQPRIQDYPEILDQHRKLHSNSKKKKRFKETRKVPFPCKHNELNSVGIYQQTNLTTPSLYGVKSPLQEPAPCLETR